MQGFVDKRIAAPLDGHTPILSLHNTAQRCSFCSAPHPSIMLTSWSSLDYSFNSSTSLCCLLIPALALRPWLVRPIAGRLSRYLGD